MSSEQNTGITLQSNLITSFDNGGEGATEIVAINETNRLIASTNGNTDSVDVFSLISGAKIGSLNIHEQTPGVDLSGIIGGITSVSITDTHVVASHVGAKGGDAGYLAIYDYSQYSVSGEISTRVVQVGVHPDSVTVNAAGTTAYVANEGELQVDDDGNRVDGAGSISIVDLTTLESTEIGFSGFSDAALENVRLSPAMIELYGSRAAAAEFDIEPEYVALSPDEEHLFVSLQEANSVARVDLTQITVGSQVSPSDVMTILPLGSKDHSVTGAGLDVSDRDDQLTFDTQPVRGLYMPDSLATMEIDGLTYFITANEGDGRDGEERGAAFADETRVEDATLDAALSATLDISDEGIGRLNISSTDGDTDGDGDIDQLHSFGARSFSIWNENGELVYDSGDDLGALFAEYFETTALDVIEGRSDNKGTEPEALEVFTQNDNTYLAVGLERASQIPVFDITDPSSPVFEMFLELSESDISPEEIAITTVGTSSIAIVSNEVSGTLSAVQITDVIG